MDASLGGTSQPNSQAPAGAASQQQGQPRKREAKPAAAPPPQAPTQGQQVRTVAELIAGREPAPAPEPEKHAAGSQDEPAAPLGEPAPADEAEQGEEDQGEAPTKPASIDDVAKALGLTNKELNAVEVSINGETMTLGQLKDKMPALAKLESQRIDFDEAKERHGLEHLDNMRRLHAIVEAFPPGSVPPQVMQRIEAQHVEKVQREARLLQTARPEFADPAFTQAAIKRMAEIAAPYGISPHEVASTVDHRHLLLLHDYVSLKDRFEKARAQAQKTTLETGGRMNAEGAAQVPDKSRRVSKQGELTSRVARLIANRR